jgi:hypothetical protein
MILFSLICSLRRASSASAGVSAFGWLAHAEMASAVAHIVINFIFFIFVVMTKNDITCKFNNRVNVLQVNISCLMILF